MMKPPTFFILILHVLCLYRGSCGLRPLIQPNEKEIVINAGDSIYFECVHFDKIFFFFPEYNDEDGQETVTSKPQKGKSEGDGLYKYVFLRRNAAPTDTGWYGCAGHNKTISPKIFDDPEFSWIYFYVSSSDRLFVEKNDVIEILELGHEIILPCRPTSPDLKVNLYKMSSLGEVKVEGTIWYDAKFGFKLIYYSEEDTGMYTCVAIIDFELQRNFYALFLSGVFIIGPIINDNTPKYLIRGQNMYLNCTVYTQYEEISVYRFGWITPSESSRISRKDYTMETNNDTVQRVTELIIKNVTVGDEGEYTCFHAVYQFIKKTTIYIKIVELYQKFIDLVPQNATTCNQVPLGGMVTWVVMIYAYPQPEIKWLLPNGDQIVSDSSNIKYDISISARSTILTIHSLDISDTGVYQLLGTIDDKLMKHLNFTLEVLAKPLLKLKNIGSNYAPGQNAYIECKVSAFPEPNITCSFLRCPNYPSKENSSLIELRNKIEKLEPHTFLSKTSVEIDVFGTINCTACNSVGCEYAFQNIFVYDSNVDLGILEPKGEIIEGDRVSIVCVASIYNYTGNITWIKGDQHEQIVDNENINVREERTPFTYRSILDISKVRKEDANIYTCIVQTTDKHFKTVSYNLFVNDQRPLIFRNSSLNGRDLSIDLNKKRYNNTITLMCYVDGMPKPNVTWYKDDVSLNNEINDHYVFVNRNQELHINYLLEKLSGKYTCRATNRLNRIEDFINIQIKGKELPKELISVIVILFILVVILVVLFIIKVRREKILRKELLETGLLNFEEGALESLNPALTVDEQAELLPYNKKWEFPRERLKLGKQIGSGSFGVVMKAEAIGIRKDETVTTVAVKMVRRTTDPAHVRALANELKIMVHLGKHLNVVNLLGACTKNVSKRELSVIVEYCTFGNLHNYLLRHRANFINQIDPANGELNFTIGTELAKSEAEVIPDDTNNTSESMSVTMSSDHCMLSDNSSQPDWRTNYRGDYKDQNLKPICTQDLLSWAFQVARGMEYLSQRKVLHGDLAARNILLAKDNIVKICDFGLAKSMYKDENYKKKGNELLPIKWMAIESIRDRIFSTQSDVWSFGIVLWEFFTLAVTPYPGLSAEKLYKKLIEGHRMEQPQYSTNEVYSIMLQCWQTESILRPTFRELVNRIGDLLEENVKAHYISLNEPYMSMNKMILNGKDDYLTMMSAPDHAAVSSFTQDYLKLPNTNNVPMSSFRSSSFMSESKDAAEISSMLVDEDDPYLKPINLHERIAEFTPQRDAANMLEIDPCNNRDSNY